VLIKATLVSRLLQGEDILLNEIPLGKVYHVDPESIADMEIYNTQTGVKIHTQAIRVIASEPPGSGWFPLELLKLEDS
jgi:hypothetical protein